MIVERFERIRILTAGMCFGVVLANLTPQEHLPICFGMLWCIWLVLLCLKTRAGRSQP